MSRDDIEKANGHQSPLRSHPLTVSANSRRGGATLRQLVREGLMDSEFDVHDLFLLYGVPPSLAPGYGLSEVAGARLGFCGI